MDSLHEKYREIVHLYMCVNRLRRSSIDRLVKNLGVHHSQHMMLMFLEKQEVTPNQKDIAKAFDISPAAVAVTLKKLENNGFITRKSFENDNRFNEIYLTEKGKCIAEKTKKDFTDADEEMFKGMSEEEIDFMIHCFTKIKNNLKQNESEDK